SGPRSSRTNRCPRTSAIGSARCRSGGSGRRGSCANSTNTIAPCSAFHRCIDRSPEEETTMAVTIETEPLGVVEAQDQLAPASTVLERLLARQDATHSEDRPSGLELALARHAVKVARQALAEAKAADDAAAVAAQREQAEAVRHQRREALT